MNLVRKRKIQLIFLSAVTIILAVSFILYALSKNISLFYTPSQIESVNFLSHQIIRLGGMVEKGSIVRMHDPLNIHFKITDFKRTILVHYRGLLPDLFKEGQGVVTKGFFKNKVYFKAVEVLAKHDEKYMPPPLKQALEENRGYKQGLRMKKSLTSTFRGLSAESSALARFLDPANKSRDVVKYKSRDVVK